jgi:hypothetical protein
VIARGLGVAAMASGVVLAQAPNPDPAATFRTTTVGVVVDVSVRRGNTPLPGLRVADFELFDNGVRQRIESMAVEAVPIDVTLAIDTSGSVINDLEAFKSEVRQFVRLLRPVDRVRVIAIATGVDEIVPMAHPAGDLDLRGLKAGGFTSTNDGLVYALLWPTDVDRRHLVIALTDGVDTQSTLESSAVVDAASRARAVFHLILVDGLGPLLSGWQRSARDAVVDAAKRSGGTVHDLRRASNDFKRIFDDFRASYVLRYSPEGVSRAGWHDVKVGLRVPDASKLTIRAKQGYWSGR